ncbi:hypothetical protein DSO57_1000746 [Entomophthora muscae]|uniref:Uncharacterized protein n=1 Tax=Entomophthora muscae TaxID=34485 RepID=A0ACC2T9B4_9FUNG|nr:hypothetical protein DSO57_1000746 [Entomophthora muscae]
MAFQARPASPVGVQPDSSLGCDTVIDFPRFDIVLGLDWLQKNNPHVDWATSVLTIKRRGVNHQIYPDSVDQLLRNHVFVSITETLDKKENLKAIH